MKIKSWNIQSTKGCDGQFDENRILDVLNMDGIAEVICLQEVSRYFEDYGGNDQLQLFKETYPDHIAVWGAALSWPGNQYRREFGNLTLVRNDLLLDYRIHPLPHPPAGGVCQMPRVMVETLVKDGGEVLSVFNTHLAFHNGEERFAQVRYLTDRMSEGVQRSIKPDQKKGPGAYEIQKNPLNYILCGDLNLTTDSEEYDFLVTLGNWNDAWTALYPDTVHAPTCGIFDADQWKEGPHCRDYFFFSPVLHDQLVSLMVDQKTDASDHQPITLEIRENTQ
ncbi:MAG: endonuclease/exonuclease/phosphatase family protein [Sneathiellales bacterium]|nr:endonuclease/exonuclease/phosphatase family protein [Sneathiellales bacterium]